MKEMSRPVRLMHRYVEEYTNAHDLAVAREIMHPEYRFHMSGQSLDLDAYLDMVAGAFDHFPDLWLSVDRLIVNHERLAMAFRESATAPGGASRGSWHGVALYRIHPDGRLLSATVEQDFWARRRQLRGDDPPVPMPATDPSVWETEPRPADPDTESAVRSWVDALLPGDVRFDGGSTTFVDADAVTVDDIIIAGNEFALRVTMTGTYRIDDPADLGGTLDSRSPVVLHACGVGSIDSRGTITARFVTDRYGFRRAHARR